ncbi:MAG: NAD dependent epimerase/dehydratase family [Erysipelotrichaceae bacterium]|nr:MAG: NAD dependent epimerase/dehydratase [Erysipelotrichaceae bacterium]TXT18476.1 MAG: NAD dependent epimerase/dehydratase family [Erysipelotrichaceae bacterium]
MKKILLTGSTGFIGRNILPILQKHFEVVVPKRQDLNLMDENEVKTFLFLHKFDAVIHNANPNPVKNNLDQPDLFLEDSLRMFANLYASRAYFGKLIYMGSGAEYDKSLDITNIKEEDFGRSVPKDTYGLSKYIMNIMAQSADNVIDLCVFACYGPYDHPSKFITHCIQCCLNKTPISIRQDCKFDYLHVFDVAKMLVWLIDNNPKHTTYNAGSGRHLLLSDIAKIVVQQFHLDLPIEVQSPGLNKEYTANVTRFVEESGLMPSIPIEIGIAMQIQWEKEHSKL